MQDDKLLELNGLVEQIIFRNDKNQYTIIELNTGNELITVTGIIPLVNVGEELHIIGTWINHPNFGMQFKGEAFERCKPTTVEAILKYLSSGAIKGIGPITATKMVDSFGENTIDIIENDPERLTSIKGITKAKALKISEEFKKVYGIKEIMIYLSKFGITPEEAVRVWKQFGLQSEEQIQADPYCLCSDTLNIDFDRVDIIAQSLDFPPQNNSRIKAGIVHVLKHNLNNGHTCLPMDKLIKASSKLLEISNELCVTLLEELIMHQVLISQKFINKEYIFLPTMYQCEVYCAQRLQMMKLFPAQSIVGIENYISEIEKSFNILYAEAQKQAIIEALSKGILILTGGPGTGKTTTLNAIISILEKKGERVLLAAPTGRAAKRMSELTGKDAKTIHRLLQVEWDQNDVPVFSKNEKNLLECDALILDELSMVDSLLFEAVLRALPLGCRLIMVGDCDQLPSVGAGNVLGDLISSNQLPVVQLKEIFRQSMQSLIITNAHKIVAGFMPELHIKSNDFFFLHANYPKLISQTIVSLYVQRLPSSYGYSPLTDIQILAPGRKGELGTNELNKNLQFAINPPEKGKKEVKINNSIFREGDKVMQIRNDYNLQWTKIDGTTGEGVFNGDVGILLDVDKRAGTLTVQIDDKFILYDMDRASELELAYAMTVHKSQGNEFNAVIIPMYPGAPQLYYRNLLYTAITRAKSLLILIGTENTVKIMVDNDRKTKRYTGLFHFISIESDENIE